MIFTDWFPPAYKAGGPVQSVSNLVELLKHEFRIYVICRDRDLNSETKLTGIQSGIWNNMDSDVKVLYLSQKQANFKTIKSLIKDNRPNIIYINGLYSIKYSLFPALISSYYGIQTCFISVRGMLHASALSVKPFRKQVFLAFARGFGLYRHSTMLASSEWEAIEIRNALGRVKLEIAPNIPLPPQSDSTTDSDFKLNNRPVRFLFLGRIAPEKNPLTLLKALKLLKSPCSVTFSGASLDSSYKAEFDKALRDLPDQIKVQYIGDVPHSSVSELFRQNDVLVLPSLGENFGHAIFESFAHSVPVIIGNNTPWTGIQDKKAGMEVDPYDAERIAESMTCFMRMDHNEYTEWRSGAAKVAIDYFASNNFKEVYLKIFS